MLSELPEQATTKWSSNFLCLLVYTQKAYSQEFCSTQRKHKLKVTKREGRETGSLGLTYTHSLSLSLVAKSRLTLATPWTVACQVPVHGILQARILVWVAISSSTYTLLYIKFDKWDFPGGPGKHLPRNAEDTGLIYTALKEDQACSSARHTQARSLNS